MSVAELELAQSLPPRGLTVRVVGDIGESDLALLASDRGIKPLALTKLRDRHHALARCLISGMRDAEASAVTGYTPARISVLKGDPSFKKLLADYKGIADAAFADYHERATQLSLDAINTLHDRLEDTPEAFENLELLKIAESTADRTGHAPIAKNVNINANVDLGTRLAAARARVAKDAA